MKFIVVLMAVFGTLMSSWVLPFLGNVVFHVLGIGITWTMLLAIGVLVAGLKLQASK